VDYKSAFPNVTNVLHSDTNQVNTISLKRIADGNYFISNTSPAHLWQRAGDTNWDSAAFSPELPPMSGQTETNTPAQ
jgi:hypothetical protein